MWLSEWNFVWIWIFHFNTCVVWRVQWLKWPECHAVSTCHTQFSMFLYNYVTFLISHCVAGVPASSTNCLDSLQDESPPHWLKSLQALTEMDVPSGSTVTPQPPHNIPFCAQMSLHRASWAPYLPPVSTSAPSQFHSPPPGFQTAFRTSAQPPTDLLQSAGLDRH